MRDERRAVSGPVVGEVEGGLPSRAYARTVVFLRLLVVPGLLVAAFAAWNYLPGISTLPESGVGALLPADTKAVQSEREAARLFGSSLLPRIAIVQRNADGLSLRDQRRIVGLAIRLDRDSLPGFPRGSRALPYLNTSRLLPGARERSTTAITYLGFPSSYSPGQQQYLANRYAELVSIPRAPAAATGFIPGSILQSNQINGGLAWVELATVLVIAGIIGLYLRSLLAPLVTLATAGLAYLIGVHVVSYLAQKEGMRVENEVEPIIVVLLLGVVTDYSVFFLAGMRGRLRRGEEPREAARRATSQFLPIIVTAGLIVAAGLATLRIASIGFVQSLGPAMAVVVLVSLGVSILFVPAAMGLLGRALFWPGLRERGVREPLLTRAGAAGRRGLARATSLRVVAIPLVLLAAAALVFFSTGLAHTSLALTPIRGLADTSPPQRAADAASRGFAAGMIAPTELVVEAPGITARKQSLRRLGRALRAQPQTGAVIGAGIPPLPKRFQPAFSSRSGGAVRYFVALRDHPYSSAAIDDLASLEESMPRLLRSSGLGGARVLYAGDTALAKETVSRITHDLVWVGLAAAAVNLVLLAVFLRALVAPLLLVGSSLLAITATFGLTTYVCRDLLGMPDLTYFIPLAVGVLLLSFGTDYNLFVVGRIWQEAKVHDTRQAIRLAVPRASRAISIAGIALACSFATLALIPIAPFREFAIAVGAGVLIDTFLVRTLLIPALLAGFGNLSWWPGRRARTLRGHTDATAAGLDSTRRSARPREPRGTWSG